MTDQGERYHALFKTTRADPANGAGPQRSPDGRGDPHPGCSSVSGSEPGHRLPQSEQPGGYGPVRRVSIPGQADRFDHTLCWHSHLYCTVCGSVVDAQVDEQQLMQLVQRQQGIVQECAVTLFGLCADCCARQAAEDVLPPDLPAESETPGGLRCLRRNLPLAGAEQKRYTKVYLKTLF